MRETYWTLFCINFECPMKIKTLYHNYFNLTILIFTLQWINSLAVAIDRIYKPEINWASQGEIDFCPQSSHFDFRNAFWLGALSYFSYWEPKYNDQLVCAKAGTPISVLFEQAPPQTQKDLKSISIENSNLLSTHSLGFGTLYSKHFTSESPKPENQKIYSNRYQRWIPPLPEKACQLPEFNLCFTRSFKESKGMISHSLNCGIENINAYLSETRLKNIQLLLSGKPLSTKDRSQAIKDKNRVEMLVKEYETAISRNKSSTNNKKSLIELDWKDPTTVKRCSSYYQKWSFKPDTQLSLYENVDALFIAIRGTEPDNDIDFKTDFLSNTMIDLNNISSFYLTESNPITRKEIIENSFFTKNLKGQIHEGFFRATDVIGKWLINELQYIRQIRPESKNKPIFITGHSLGGAIGLIILHNLMTINNNNHSLKDFAPYNLKALYTFGSPRVGNILWAQEVQKLAKEQKIGLYNLVNENDLVAHAPCLKYSHVGSHIHLNLSQSISKASTDKNHQSCSYLTALLNPHRFSEMLKDHYMVSYFYKLSTLRSEFNTIISHAKSEAILSGNKIAMEQLNYPANCSKGPHTPQFKGPLSISFENLPISVEGLEESTH